MNKIYTVFAYIFLAGFISIIEASDEEKMTFTSCQGGPCLTILMPQHGTIGQLERSIVIQLQQSIMEQHEQLIAKQYEQVRVRQRELEVDKEIWIMLGGKRLSGPYDRADFSNVPDGPVYLVQKRKKPTIITWFNFKSVPRTIVIATVSAVSFGFLAWYFYSRCAGQPLKK
jgi:hypothetical protein